MGFLATTPASMTTISNYCDTMHGINQHVHFFFFRRTLKLFSTQEPNAAANQCTHSL
jgi:hypothetical protein